MATAVRSIPDYIDYLVSPDTPLGFHVNVGNPDLCPQERIGVVKWMLIARSKVFRVMLLESEMRHKKEMNITDLDPVTFKHFLVFMYGHDNTSTLQFNAAVSLLCAAEKYEVRDLKSKLGNVITSQVTVDNVFVVLQEAYVCETVPKLWEIVTKTVQCHTGELFSHAQFPTVSREVLLHIVQQDRLSVPEIEVWKAALNWSTHQVQPEKGVISAENLRLTILPFLKHIRLRTLSAETVFREVLPTQILTVQELGELSRPAASSSSDLICAEMNERGPNIQQENAMRVFTHNGIWDYCVSNNYDQIELITKDSDIELCSVEFNTKSPAALVRLIYQTLFVGNCLTITISHIAITGVYCEPVVGFRSDQKLGQNIDFKIALKHNNRNLVLKANNKYIIRVQNATHTAFQLFRYYTTCGLTTTDSFDVRFINNYYNRESVSVIKSLNYKKLNTRR